MIKWYIKTTGSKGQMVCLKYVNHKNPLGQTLLNEGELQRKIILLQHVEKVEKKLIFPCLQI